MRDYKPGLPKGGTIIAQGASAVSSLVEILPELDARGLNVKLVCSVSPQLFKMQPEAYRRSVISPGDQADSTVITTQARWLMHDWLFNKVAEEYALLWPIGTIVGGPAAMLLEVPREAHLSPKWLLDGIGRLRARPRRAAAPAIAGRGGRRCAGAIGRGRRNLERRRYGRASRERAGGAERRAE